MAKIYGLFGSMQGKVADVVMAVRNGEQIVRKYQPIVSNPKSDAQIAARAKLKLLSQLSAVMAPAIAIPRRGSVSSRNLFTKKNYALSSFSNNQADIALLGIQLTDSVIGMPTINAVRGESGVTVSLLSRNSSFANRVVYVLFSKGSDGLLRLVASEVVSSPGDGSWSTSSLPLVSGEGVVFAYALRDNTQAARVAFGNLQVVSAETVAKLVVRRVLTESDVTITQTTAAAVPAAV